MIDLSKKEHSFGAFTLGVAVGVGAALLFGTEDGKKLSKSLFEKLPDSIKQLTDKTSYPQEAVTHHHSHSSDSPPPAPHITPTLPRLS